MHSIRIIGPGRAGTSLAAALSARGWEFAGFLGRHDELARRRRRRRPARHRHPRRCRGRRRRRGRARRRAPRWPTSRARSGSTRWRRTRCGPPCTRWCRCPTARSARPASARASPSPWPARPWHGTWWPASGGRVVEVADGDRAAYHAAACIAANHVVALLGQVERVAASVGLDLESFLPLTRAAVDDVAALGAGAALTGPARRGDWATLSRHLDALPESERAGYQAGAALATRLAHSDCRRRPRDGAEPRRPSRRRCRAATVDVVETVGRVPGRCSTRPAPPAGRSGWCPPWAPCTTGTSSLMTRARAECDVVAVSIFVNPLQFGDPEDIAHYPRTLERDLRRVRRGGRRRRLRPERGRDVPVVARRRRRPRCRCAGVSERWEGASRPGHFDGVATVVAKLFTIAGPCRAYFGLKDFQQLAVVRRMALDLSLPVEVVGCPIVREADGLALSSRNVRLSAGRAAGGDRALAGPGRRPGRPGRRASAPARPSPRPCAPSSPPSRWCELDYAVRGRRRHASSEVGAVDDDRGARAPARSRPRWARSG